MNDFHMLSIYLGNKDKLGAMRVFRDKTEFAARKILEKLKVDIPLHTGKLFWNWVQSWIFNSCRQECKEKENNDTGQIYADRYQCTPAVEPGSTGYDQINCVTVHVDRPHQHIAAATNEPLSLCNREDGISAICVDMGSECGPISGTTAASGQPVVALGSHNPAYILAGFSSSTPVVRLKYPLRLRRGNSIFCPSVSIREGWCDRRAHPSRDATISTSSRKLWVCRDHAYDVTGHPVQHANTCTTILCRCRSSGLAGFPERNNLAAGAAGGYAFVSHTPDTRVSGRRCGFRRKGLPIRNPAIYVGAVLLPGLCRSSGFFGHTCKAVLMWGLSVMPARA